MDDDNADSKLSKLDDPELSQIRTVRPDEE